MTRRRTWLVILTLVTVATALVLATPPSGPRSLRQSEPDETAALELDLWQAVGQR